MNETPEEIAIAVLEELGLDPTDDPITQLRQLHTAALTHLAATPHDIDPTGPEGAAYETALDHACAAAPALARIDHAIPFHVAAGLIEDQAT
jgi:hypothetical protein